MKQPDSWHLVEGVVKIGLGYFVGLVAVKTLTGQSHQI